MAAKKISALSDAGLPLSGAERLCGVQDSSTVGFAVDDLWDAPIVAAGTDAARALTTRLGEVVNVKDFGAGSGDAAIDTPAIKAAWAAGMAAAGAPHLYFPPGTYFFADDILEIVTDYSLLFGDNATIVFQGSGLWQCGTDVVAGVFPEFRDLAFKVDPSSSATAPLSFYNIGRASMQRCWFHDVKASGVILRKGVLHMRGCDMRMSLTAGVSHIACAIPGGLSGALFVQGGRFSAAANAARTMIDHSGAGKLDGLVLQGLNATQLDHVLVSAPASGGQLSNMMAFGCLFDQVDQEAFKFVPAAGATLSDVTITGNKINGFGSSTATSGAQVSVDLTSGAAHNDVFKVTDNVFKGARNRAFECLGGSFRSLVFARNAFADYGRRNNAASRAAYVTGTFDYLEIADNHGETSWTHDYDLELTGVTATKRKVEGNTFAGWSLANLAALNSPLLSTRREVLQADRTYYVRTDGSDANAGLVNSAAGAFRTLQGAATVILALDFNGHNVVLQLADNTVGVPAYTGGLNVSIGNAPSPVGAGLLTIQGNAATPANVLISTTSVQAMTFQIRMSVRIRIKDLKLQTTTQGNALEATEPVEIQFENVDFGACAGFHLNATNGARLFARNPYTVSGAATGHTRAVSGGAIFLNGRTITITGMPAITTFHTGADMGRVEARSTVYSGSVTGKQYDFTGLSLLDAAGAGASIPGGTAGTTSGGGTVI